MSELLELTGETEEANGVLINGIKYSYSITKKENENESLIIKLYDSTKKSNIYFTYEAQMTKLIKDFKFLSLCESLEEMIASLNNIFSLGNARVEQNNENYKLELIFVGSGISKNCLVPLTRHRDVPEKPKSELEMKIDKLENKFNDLLNKYEELKVCKENIITEDNIRNLIKEVIFDKDVKIKLFEEMEQHLLSKYNLNDISKNKDNKADEVITNKIQNIINNKEEKINNQILLIQEQLKENIEYINNIKVNNNIYNNRSFNNFIILKVKIDKNNLNKDIILFNQVSINKYFCNFEREDVEVIIDDKIAPPKFKNRYNGSKCDDKSEKSEELEYNLEVNGYYWNFSKIGIHTIKIIFKKKLLQCNELFYGCNSIYKIDCSYFDCSQIIDCSKMFFDCSALIEINLGKLDFSFSKDFSWMFYRCENLEKLDVSYLNTHNSKSFSYMFDECSKLKEINISKFKTTNCENIANMFYDCYFLESIDMLNWDMKNIKKIDNLFFNCSSLKRIKMNFNNDKAILSKDLNIFYGLSEEGFFVWKRGIDCKKLLGLLPVSWNRTQE